MRLTDILSNDDLRDLTSGKNTKIRSLIYQSLDKMVDLETLRMLKSPEISDDFNKDIRTQIGVINGLKSFKKFLTEVDNLVI